MNEGKGKSTYNFQFQQKKRNKCNLLLQYIQQRVAKLSYCLELKE